MTDDSGQEEQVLIGGERRGGGPAVRDVSGPARLRQPQDGRRAQPTIAAWERHYLYAVISSDLLATALALVIATTLLGSHFNVGGDYQLPLSIVITELVVICSLAACRAWRSGALGQGAEEFRRLGRALLTA